MMPWNKVELMLQRKVLIEKLLLQNANLSAICRAGNISRKTAYKWLARYRIGQLTALEDKSKAPLYSSLEICVDLEKRIVTASKEQPYWGFRKLRKIYC